MYIYTKPWLTLVLVMCIHNQIINLLFLLIGIIHIKLPNVKTHLE